MPPEMIETEVIEISFAIIYLFSLLGVANPSIRSWTDLKPWPI